MQGRGGRRRRRLVPAQASADPRHRGLRGQVRASMPCARWMTSASKRRADRRRRRFRARLDAQPAADCEEPHACCTAAHEFRAAPDSVNKMMALVARRQRSISCSARWRRWRARAVRLEGRHRQGARTARVRYRLRRAAAVLRADHEARPGRQLGARSSNENLIAVDTAKFETSRAGHLRDRRHQHLSRQAQAHPVRLPRGRADGAGGARAYVFPDKKLDLPVHDLLDQPAEEARRHLTASSGVPRPLFCQSIDRLLRANTLERKFS